MLFNSFEFIFLFVPLVVAAFYFAGRLGRHSLAISALILGSLFFYAWWNPVYLALLIGSILFNFGIGLFLLKSPNNRKIALTAGITGNLACLGYFKYANFFVDNINVAFGSSYNLETIILPLGISFFTFQQIAYLVDSYQRKTEEYNFLNYTLFVTFFPQLIAGPIVHHKEMMPQFADKKILKFVSDNLAMGCTIFTIGLFKKVVLADKLALSATPVFQAADAGESVTFAAAWLAAFAYTFQLYFDFSAYSDMAIGCGRMVGIKLPENFSSPYKSRNIIDFWRHWHMTLSRFLKDYLYIPLGGNRKGEARRYTNIMITMLLGGLWHGAGWTFLIWGGLHGLYLSINHLFQKIFGQKESLLRTIFGFSITFFAVVIAWVVFRAETFTGAASMLTAMTQFHEISGILQLSKLGLLLVAVSFVICVFLPNTLRIVQQCPRKILYFLAGVLLFICCPYIGAPSEFLYFQF